MAFLQAENPESSGLNLPGSPSHAAEAVYAVPSLQSFFSAWRGSRSEGEALGSCPADRGLHWWLVFHLQPRWSVKWYEISWNYHPHPVRKQAGPTVKKEQCRPLCCPNMHITEFVRKFGMCTINLLWWFHKSCYIHWGQACSQNALNAQFHWLNSAQKPECEAWTSGTELEDDGGNG